MPVKMSSRVAFSFLLASMACFALHCSSDDSATPSNSDDEMTSTGGSSGTGGGASTGGSSSAGSNSNGRGGSQSSGGSGGSGGSSTGSGGKGGAAGSGGSGGSGGAGGSGGSGGSAGAGGSGGSGGGSGVTFAQVQQLLSMSCAGTKCHSAGTMQIDWVTSAGLYGRLTSPIPNTVAHCVGDKPIVAQDMNSLLLRAIQGATDCTKAGGGTDHIGKMPDNCSATGMVKCLTTAQIKLLTDWVAAGAPNN